MSSLVLLIVDFYDVEVHNEYPYRASIASADHEGICVAIVVFAVTEC
jgi:hypothetical protein